VANCCNYNSNLSCCSFNIQLARFRQLMDAKKLNEEESSSTSLTPRSASSVQPTSLHNNHNSQTKSSGGAKSWPGKSLPTFQSLQKDDTSSNNNNTTPQSISLNNNESKQQPSSSTQTTEQVKENQHSNNFTAMKQIMRRKQLSTAAMARKNSSTNDVKLVANAQAAMDQVLNNNNISSTASTNNSEEEELSISVDGKDSESTAASWAMLGNHLNETTMDRDELITSADEDDMLLLLSSSDNNMMITPVALKRRQHELHTESLNDGGSASDVGGGASGVLSFLGESPLFDQTIEEEEGEGEDEAERNLCKSAEKVKKLEEHLLRNASIGGGGSDVLSPVQQASKGVTFAIQDGWETPRGNDGDRATKHSYPKSPYINGNSDMFMTPNTKKRLGESMEAQVNPMNESMIVSDDEASGDEYGSPSPLKGIGSDAENDVAYNGESSSEENEFDSPENSDIEFLSGMMESKGNRSSSRRSKRYNRSNNTDKTSPTRAALMERNQTLVKEVRFADQTCVELSERKKHYKNSYIEANKENTLLRTKYESSLQETAKLKVLVESLQAQKNQADLQVEAYRTQITDTEKTHRSSLKKMEKTYDSHLNKSEDQINSLNDRLQESLTVNTTLQSKLDDVHNKWESKLHSDAASKELITSLKERVASGDVTASNADASMQTMQTRLTDLQKLCDQHKHELQRERNEREMVEHDRDELQTQCDDLHKQLTEWAQTSDTLGDVFFNEDGSMNIDFVEELKEFTPVKELRLDHSSRDSAANPPSTPTSNLLARTLRSELKRRETVSEKLDQAEQQVTSLKNTISEMKMDIEEVKADNALLIDDIEERDVHIVELQVQMAGKDEEITRLNEEFEILIHENQESATSSEESQPQNNNNNRDTVSILEERLNAVEDTLDYADEELTEAKARLADTQELLDDTAGKLEQSEDELAKAQDQVDKLFKNLKDKEEEHANLVKFSEFQTATLEAMKEKLSQNEKVNAEQGHALTDAPPTCNKCAFNQEQINQLRERVHAVKGERDNAKKQLEQAHMMLKEFQDELSKQDVGRNEEIESFKMQCEELEDKLLAVTSDLETCQEENKVLSDAASAAENEVSQQLSIIRTNNADLMSENETLRVSLQSFELQLENEKSLLKATREEADGYRRDISSAKAAFECLTTESAISKASLANVEKETQDLREVVTEKEKQLKICQEKLSAAQSTFKEQYDNLKSCCADLETRLSVEESNRLSAEASLDDATKQINMLGEALEEAEEMSEEKQNECQELIVQVKQIRNALADAEGDKAEADTTVQRLEDEIQENKSILLAHEQCIIQLKDELRQKDNDHQTVMQEKDSKIEMLEQACTSRQTLFTEQLERTRVERDEAQKDLKSMVDRLQDELQTSNQSRQELGNRSKAVIRELEEELLHQNEAQHILERDVIHMQSRIEDETRKYESKCQDLEVAHKEIERVTDRLNSLEMDGERLATKTEDEVADLMEERNYLLGERAQLEEKVELLQADIEEVDELRQYYSAQNDVLQRKCIVFKEKIKELNEKNHEWELSYKSQSDELVRVNTQVSDLKRVLLSSRQSGEGFVQSPDNTPRYTQFMNFMSGSINEA